MFISLVTNSRRGFTKAMLSVSIMGGIFFLICAVLLFQNVSKIIYPSQMIETIKALIHLTNNYNLILPMIFPVVEIGLVLMTILKLKQLLIFLCNG